MPLPCNMGRTAGTAPPNPWAKWWGKRDASHDKIKKLYTAADKEVERQGKGAVDEQDEVKRGKGSVHYYRFLTVCVFTLYTIETLYGLLMSTILPNCSIASTEVVPGSPCVLYTATDGRVSLPSSWYTAKTKGETSNKAFYAYQVVALFKFGLVAMMRVPPAKATGASLVVSHICGVRNCCNPDHLILESKDMNDARTACHTCLLTWLARKMPVLLFQMWACRHTPACCTHLQDEHFADIAKCKPIKVPEAIRTELSEVAESKRMPWGVKGGDPWNAKGLSNLRALGTSTFALATIPNDDGKGKVISSGRSSELASAVAGMGASLTQLALGALVPETVRKSAKATIEQLCSSIMQSFDRKRKRDDDGDSPERQTHIPFATSPTSS